MMYEPTVISSFDESSKRYRCCCGCCHVRICLYIVAVLDILAGLGWVYDSFRDVIHGYKIVSDLEPKDVDTGVQITQLIIAVFLIISAVLLIVGIAKLKKGLVIPRMVMSVVIILFTIAMVILFVLTFTETTEWRNGKMLLDKIRENGGGDDTETFQIILVAIVCGVGLIVVLVETWVLCCLTAVHRWIKDKLWYEYGGADAIPLKSTNYA